MQPRLFSDADSSFALHHEDTAPGFFVATFYKNEKGEITDGEGKLCRYAK